MNEHDAINKARATMPPCLKQWLDQLPESDAKDIWIWFDDNDFTNYAVIETISDTRESLVTAMCGTTSEISAEIRKLLKLD